MQLKLTVEPRLEPLTGLGAEGASAGGAVVAESSSARMTRRECWRTLLHCTLRAKGNLCVDTPEGAAMAAQNVDAETVAMSNSQRVTEDVADQL